MKLISVNVGLPRDVEWQGRTVTTAFFKTAVEGPVELRRHNLEGDRQADKREPAAAGWFDSSHENDRKDCQPSQ